MNIVKLERVPGECWIDQHGNSCTVRDDGTIRVCQYNDEPTLTIQSEKDACDIDKIVSKFKTTGLMTNVRQDTPQYGDFSEVTDYQTALIRIQEADEAFMTLPAAIRKRFDNDPGKLIQFLENSENRAEALELGLIDGQKEDSSVAPPTVSDPAGPSIT